VEGPLFQKVVERRLKIGSWPMKSKSSANVE